MDTPGTDLFVWLYCTTGALSYVTNVLYTVNENRVFLLKQEFCFSNHSQSVSVYSAFGRSVGEA